MARGQKTEPETIYKVMASYAVTQNYSQTARALGMPASTVKDIVDKNLNNPDFVKLQDETKATFVDSASSIIEKGMTLLERRFDRALTHEAELDAFIDAITDTPTLQLSQQEKSQLITKLRGLQLQDVKSITTAIGTLYDKRALAEGKPTERTEVIGGDTLSKLAELAGYERK